MWEAAPNATMHIIRDEFLWSKAWKFAHAEEWRSVVRSMKTDRNVHTKLLVNDSKEERSHAAYYTHVKAFEYGYLPKGREVKDFALYVVGDIVSIMSMENNNLVGIKITNAALAKNYVTLFGVLWDGSTKPTPRYVKRNRK